MAISTHGQWCDNPRSDPGLHEVVSGLVVCGNLRPVRFTRSSKPD